MKRLLAVGLDAGDLDFVLMRSTSLPNLKSLIQSGTLARVKAPRCLSGSVWPTFAAGREPGVHGIYQHLVWDPQRMGLQRIGAQHSYNNNFWNKLDDKSVRSIVLDVPYCFPAPLRHGAEIYDWGTHGQTLPIATNSAEVSDWLKKFGKSPIGREAPIEKSAAELRRIESTLLQSVKAKADLVEQLMDNFEWDFCLPVFAEAHRAGHIFHSDDDLQKDPTQETPLLRVYQALDQAIGRILGLVDSSDVVVSVFSTHGMTRDRNQSGLVQKVMARLNQKFLGASSAESSGGWVRRLREVIPDGLQLQAANLASDSLRQWIVEQEVIGGLDWPNTPAFALRTDIRSEIRLNIKGRERLGVLEAGSTEMERYRTFLQDAFFSLRDADSEEPLVADVVALGEIFAGPNSQLLPDYAIEWRDCPAVERVSSSVLGEFCITPLSARGGDHRDEGFVLVNYAEDSLTMPSRVSEIGSLFQQLLGVTPDS